jgi:tetratricopeptide (TPR) repeat protein
VQEESLSKEEKLAQFKRRMNFRSILRKGDFYSIKNMKETALDYYLNAYKRLPNDTVLEKKIGDTYFEMKNYTNAYEYYKKIPS